MKGLAEDEHSETLMQEKKLPDETGKRPIRIGVSGKRYISAGEKDRVYKEIKKTIDNILKRSDAKQFIGYTALAAGADIIFANVVKNEFHQPLQVILPFSIEEYKKDLGIKEVVGEKGFTTPERVSIIPTFELNGIWEG
jgi:hypothetical protein